MTYLLKIVETVYYFRSLSIFKEYDEAENNFKYRKYIFTSRRLYTYRGVWSVNVKQRI